MVRYVQAVGWLRSVRGGSQPQVYLCDDGAEYVVKHANNPQCRRVLANEWIATRLAAWLGLPVPELAIVDVSPETIAKSEARFRLGRSSARPEAGLCFGSRILAGRNVDWIPPDALGGLTNRLDFLGMLVFDKWTCNTDARQVVFNQPDGAKQLRAVMVDQGFCFNAGEWGFPDGPLRGVYCRNEAYATVTGIDSFAPWLARLETLPRSLLDSIALEMPGDWTLSEAEALRQLFDTLHRRRLKVEPLIVSARDTYRQPFPNWSHCDAARSEQAMVYRTENRC